jgi:hypothetical protein
MDYSSRFCNPALTGRSQEAWRARLSLGDPGHQALP